MATSPSLIRIAKSVFRATHHVGSDRNVRLKASKECLHALCQAYASADYRVSTMSHGPWLEGSVTVQRKHLAERLAATLPTTCVKRWLRTSRDQRPYIDLCRTKVVEASILASILPYITKGIPYLHALTLLTSRRPNGRCSRCLNECKHACLSSVPEQ